MGSARATAIKKGTSPKPSTTVVERPVVQVTTTARSPKADTIKSGPSPVAVSTVVERPVVQVTTTASRPSTKSVVQGSQGRVIEAERQALSRENIARATTGSAVEQQRREREAVLAQQRAEEARRKAQEQAEIQRLISVDPRVAEAVNPQASQATNLQNLQQAEARLIQGQKEQQAIKEQTAQKQQQLQQQGLVGGFGTTQSQLSAIDLIANLGKSQQAFAQETTKDAGQGITTPFGGFATREAQQRELQNQISSLGFGGFGTAELQQQALDEARRKAREKFPDAVAEALSGGGVVTNAIVGGPRERITESVEIGGPSFIGGVTTDEQTQFFGGRELPLRGELPEPTKEARKEQLLQQRGGAPEQVTIGSLALDRLQQDQILGRGEAIGKTELIYDPITGAVIGRKPIASTGLEGALNLSLRREQDVFRAINVIQADQVRGLNVRPDDGKGSPAQAIAFLEARQSGLLKSPDVFTRFGQGAGVTGFQFEDALGRVTGTVGPIGTAGFDDFGLSRPSTRGALGTEEGRAEISRRLVEVPDFSVAESLGFQPPPRATGQLVVTTDRPLGDTVFETTPSKLTGLVTVKRKSGKISQVTPETAQRLADRGELADISSGVGSSSLPFITPSAIFGDQPQTITPSGKPITKPTVKTQDIQPHGDSRSPLFVSSLFPSVPQAFGEVQTVVQVKPERQASSINLQGQVTKTVFPEQKIAGVQGPVKPSGQISQTNPFGRSDVKDTSGVGEFFDNLGKQSGISSAVVNVKEFGRGFGESLQNELIALQNVGSLATGGQIPSREEFRTPSSQVFGGIIGGAVDQALGRGSIVESTQRGLEGAGQQFIEQPAFSAGDVTAQGVLFIPLGIAKGIGLGARAIGGVGKALTRTGKAVKAVPAKVSSEVGSLSTRATQAQIRLGNAFNEEINPAIGFASKQPAVTATRKIRPKAPTEQDFAQSFSRERAFTTEEPASLAKPRGKVRPPKPEEADFERTFSRERAFAEDVSGQAPPSRPVSPTARIDPLERVTRTTETENLRAFRENENINIAFGREPIRDLGVGEADIGFPILGLGRSSIQESLNLGGRVTTTPLGTGIGRAVKGGGQGGRRAPRVPPSATDDFTRITESAFGDVGRTTSKTTKSTKSTATRVARESDEGLQARSRAGTLTQLIPPPVRGGARVIGKGKAKTPPKDPLRSVIDDALPTEIKAKSPPKSAPRRGTSTGVGALPLSGAIVGGAGITALATDVTPDTIFGQNLVSRQVERQVQRPITGTRTGVRQTPRAEERFATVSALEPFTPQRTRQPQQEATRQRLRQQGIFEFPFEDPRAKARRAGGFIFLGGDEGGDDSGKRQRRFFRVFDVAKTPFGRVERGLGVQVQSDRAIFEVSDVAGRAPRTNITERFFAGDQTGKTRSKLRSGQNPIIDEEFFS